MKKKALKITIIAVLIICAIIGAILYLRWGLIPTLSFLGALFVGGGVLAGNRKSYKEVNNILTEMEEKNDKINNGDRDSIRDAFNRISRKGRHNNRD